MNDKELRDVAKWAKISGGVQSNGRAWWWDNAQDRYIFIDELRALLLSDSGMAAILKAFLRDKIFFSISYRVFILKAKPAEIVVMVESSLNEAVLNAAIEYVKTRTGGQDDNR